MRETPNKTSKRTVNCRFFSALGLQGNCVEFNKYKFEWTLLITGIIFATASGYFDIKSVCDTTWFARSGSVIVLLAAIVEYRISSYMYDEIYEAAKETARKKAVMPNVSDNNLVNGIFKSNLTIKPHSPKSRRILRLASHTLIIIGTIIWGYGDVLVH